MALCTACSFDASKLQAQSTGPRDAVSPPWSTLDAGEPSDGGSPAPPNEAADPASSVDTSGAGDALPGDAPRLLDSTGGDDGESDLGERDVNQEVGSADGHDSAVGQPSDASPTGDTASEDRSQASDDGGADEGAGAAAEVSDGSAVSLDSTGDLEAADAGEDSSGPETGEMVETGETAETGETGELGPDADTDAPDPGDGGSDGAADNVGAPAIDPDLVLWYPFDESSGTIAYDAAQFGGVARNATLASAGLGGSATFSAVSQVGTHALALSPGTPTSSGGGYVVIPALSTVAPEAITIAVWVNLAAATSSQNWERIYDFGDSSTSPTWLNLAARNGSSPYGPVFNMSKTGHATSDQQRLLGTTALAANTWYHIAVVLPAGATFTGVMYGNGAVAATSPAMTVHFSDLGATANNWLGRSQFTSDPYFNGWLDDFRVYRRALSQSEIEALMALR
jgi:hypothetical protein